VTAGGSRQQSPGGGCEIRCFDGVRMRDFVGFFVVKSTSRKMSNQPSARGGRGRFGQLEKGARNGGKVPLLGRLPFLVRELM